MPTNNIAKRERWRPVPGYEGLYSVSSHGRIKSLARTVALKGGKVRLIESRIHRLGQPGVRQVTLRADGVAQCYTVHRLVLMAFRGPPPTPKHVAQHIDGDQANNHVDNLRWAGKRRYVRNVSRRPKLTPDQARAIYNSSEKSQEVARRYGIARSLVSMIRTGRSHRFDTGAPDPRPPPVRDAPDECWRSIRGYAGRYSVSNHGRIRTNSRTVERADGLSYSMRPRILKSLTGKDGHPSVRLSTQREAARHPVSRLVLSAFAGKPPSPAHEAVHLDGNKANNRADNLQWAVPEAMTGQVQAIYNAADNVASNAAGNATNGAKNRAKNRAKNTAARRGASPSTIGSIRGGKGRAGETGATLRQQKPGGAA